jgi:hypothetical protein
LLSAKQRDNFILLSGIGVPAEELPQLLDLPAAERNRYLQAGLPVDSAQNQLADWLVLARVMMPSAVLLSNRFGILPIVMWTK